MTIQEYSIPSMKEFDDEIMTNQFSEKMIHNRIVSLYGNVLSLQGEKRIDALISMFIYFQSCTWIFKKDAQMRYIIQKAIDDFLKIDIPACRSIEYPEDDNEHSIRVSKLFTLERVIQEMDHKMKE